MSPTPASTEELYPISSDTIRALCRETLDEQLSSIGRYIIHRRRIPDYYLRQELRAEGMDKERSDKLMPSRWVTEQGRITIADEDLKALALIIFLKIQRRLMHHPVDQTYQQARIQLKETVQELMQQGLTRNVIAERLEVGGKTVNSFVRYNPVRNGPTKHCPWETLDKIALIDWSTAARARQQPQPKPTPNSISEGEIQQQIRRWNEADEKGLFQRNYIALGDDCPSCRSPWSMLRRSREQYSLPDIELNCMSCSRRFYLKTTRATAATGNRNAAP